MSQSTKDPAGRKSHFDQLNSALTQALDCYFKTLDGHQTSGLYQLVHRRIEKLLLEYVLDKTNGHYSQSAKILGISRTTLGSKIAHHQIHKKAQHSKKT